VINAAYPAAFISKAEVRDWPLIGWLAAKNETVFLRRGSRGHARIVNAEIASLLGRGRQVALFPEGTTTDGSQVHPSMRRCCSRPSRPAHRSSPSPCAIACRTAASPARRPTTAT
jgi:1-acyl-sn-glycerol-3-phosphate acyltransferase